MPDVLQKHTDYSGEISEFPVVHRYFLPNSIEVEISGIDDRDCLKTFEKRKREFRRGNYKVYMYTPRLTEHYHREREQESK